MGYLHISNLYRKEAQHLLNFKQIYALEKAHGSSSHISWNIKTLTFFSGGESHERFVALFDQEKLKAAFTLLGHNEVTVYGEVYGGKCQGMKATYGEELRFIAFDVKIGESCWLSVPDMSKFVESLGLEVVPWELTDTSLESLDKLRDRPSEIAIRRGCGNDKKREGIVLRPLIELTTNNGERLIAKHKGDAFNERSTPQKVVDTEKLAVLAHAEAIANEWVTEERLSHVLAHLTVNEVAPGIEQTGKVIASMVEDVYREAKGEIVESKDAKVAIGKRTAGMFKSRLKGILK